MEKLFSLEILVKTILFYTNKVKTTPRSADIEIDFSFGDKIFVVISRDPIDKEGAAPRQINSITSNFGAATTDLVSQHVRVDSDDITVVINAGKSVVFPTTVDEMKKLFDKKEYEFKVRNTKQPLLDLGSAKVKPAKEVLTHAIQSEQEKVFEESPGPKPNITDEAVYLHNREGANIGIIDVYVRLNNFGSKVFTNFQILDPDNTDDLNKTYYFKNEKCKDGFRIEK